MKKVRHSVFETNSSSTHSISITSNTKLNDIPLPDSEGNIYLYSQEFGWEQKTYSDFSSKAAYLIVYIRDWSKPEDNFRENFENVIKHATGCENIIYEDKFWDMEENSYESNGETITYMSSLGSGYIDHQSVEDNDYHYLLKDLDRLQRFLFSNHSELMTDNDNN